MKLGKMTLNEALQEELDEDCELKRLYYINHSVDDPWFQIFILIYVILMISSLLSNTSVCVALKRIGRRRNKKQKQSFRDNLLVRPLTRSEATRDQLISILSIFDILVSLTIPLTITDGLSKFWPLGKNSEFLCKITKSSPSVVVYSSSAIITIIAVNSYRQVLSPHKDQILPKHLKFILNSIIVASVLFAAPQFYHTKLFSLYQDEPNTSKPFTVIENSSHHNSIDVAPNVSSFTVLPPSTRTLQKRNTQENYTNDCRQYDENGWTHVVYCIEEWPFSVESLDPYSRVYYSYFTFAFQLIIPFVVISISYFSIYLKLQRHSVVRQKMMIFSTEQKIQEDNLRSKRRNKLMLSISLVYLCSWLPLGTINVLLDTYPDILGSDPTHAIIMLLVCHIVGMTSTSLNPVIYGFTNKAVRTGMLWIKLYKRPRKLNDILSYNSFNYKIVLNFTELKEMKMEVQSAIYQQVKIFRKDNKDVNTTIRLTSKPNLDLMVSTAVWFRKSTLRFYMITYMKFKCTFVYSCTNVCNIMFENV